MYMNTQIHVAPSLMWNERIGEWKMRKQYKFHGSARKSCPLKLLAWEGVQGEMI